MSKKNQTKKIRASLLLRDTETGLSRSITVTIDAHSLEAAISIETLKVIAKRIKMNSQPKARKPKSAKTEPKAKAKKQAPKAPPAPSKIHPKIKAEMRQTYAALQDGGLVERSMRTLTQMRKAA